MLQRAARAAQGVPGRRRLHPAAHPARHKPSTPSPSLVQRDIGPCEAQTARSRRCGHREGPACAETHRTTLAKLALLAAASNAQQHCFRPPQHPPDTSHNTTPTRSQRSTIKRSTIKSLHMRLGRSPGVQLRCGAPRCVAGRRARAAARVLSACPPQTRMFPLCPPEERHGQARRRTQQRRRAVSAPHQRCRGRQAAGGCGGGSGRFPALAGAAAAVGRRGGSHGGGAAAVRKPAAGAGGRLHDCRGAGQGGDAKCACGGWSWPR